MVRSLHRPHWSVTLTDAVYGGIIDILLALFPWLVLRNLLLDTREKIGLTVAMSLGALTGVVVIMRVIFQFVQGDNDFGMSFPSLPIIGCMPTSPDFMVFMSIFNFLEPAVTIIAQAIPMFRVLLARQTKMSTIRLTSSPQSPHTPRTPRTADLLMAKPSSLLENEVWDHGSHDRLSRDRHSRDRHSGDRGYYTSGPARKYGWAGDNAV